MAIGVKTGGRQKGTPNRLTQSVKAAIEQVAEGLGGPERMLDWVKESPENERIFWQTIYPKLLPLQLTGDPESPLHVVMSTKEQRDAAVAAVLRADA